MPLLKIRFPNATSRQGTITAAASQERWHSYSSASGTHDAGDRVQGAVSGATATVSGFLPERVGLYGLLAGPRNCPFLPNELLLNLTHPGNSIQLGTSLKSSISKALDLAYGPKAPYVSVPV